MPIAFPPTLYRMPLLSGDAGVKQTVDQIRGLANEALRDPQIVRLASDIVRPASAFDDLGEARALYDWVHRNIRFTKDPVNVEKLYPPAELLKIRAGDCDDISMLLATLLMAIGYPARLVTVAAVESAPDQFSHVYVEGQVNGQWIPMDPARYDSEFGVAPPMVYRARWWSLVDDSFGDLSGCDAQQFMPALSGLGNYPRFKSHLGSYGPVRTIGDAPSGSSTTANIATIAQGEADILRAAQGQPASPFDFSASGPWSSFQTQYSPYGPSAGYISAPGVTAALPAGTGTWLAIGGLVLLLAMMGGHK